jgi:hypothetical protein
MTQHSSSRPGIDPNSVEPPVPNPQPPVHVANFISGQKYTYQLYKTITRTPSGCSLTIQKTSAQLPVPHPALKRYRCAPRSRLAQDFPT